MDVSELLLGSHPSSVSISSVAVGLVATLLAAALMGYFTRCHLQERRIRKRIAKRSHQLYGGNIVLPEQMPRVKSVAETAPQNPKSDLPTTTRSELHPNPHRRSRYPHPWKQNPLRAD
jgi:hypothetical protein